MIGHYGPAFFNYFQNQNELIANGSANGTHLQMNSLTIINGIIDEYIQVSHANSKHVGENSRLTQH